jgi:DNA-binding beta-propeller fold protein YncE
MAMSELRYELVEGWEQLPKGFKHGCVPSVAVDSRDCVYLIARDDPRVIVYERDGTFVKSWGEDVSDGRTHGIAVGPDGSVYWVDDGDHTVRKFTSDGRLLMTLGTAGVPSDSGYDATKKTLYEKVASITHGGPPFNRPTNLAIAPSGDFYVSDGYGNCRVHRFSADGKLIQSWGEPGTGPGQFNLPHGIRVAADGRVLVADRENDRIQFFSPDGKYLDQWTDLLRPADIAIDRAGWVYVVEEGWRRNQRSFIHGVRVLPARVSVFDEKGNLLTRWGSPDGCSPGNFASPHGICVDSHGDIYVGEVVGAHPDLYPPDCHSLQKFTRK